MNGEGLKRYLEKRNKSFGAAFHLIHGRCEQLQDRWCSHWPEGNDHGKAHVSRVLDNLGAILGPSPISPKALSERELALAMTAVVAHDIGVLRGRDGHAKTSAALFKEIAKQNPLLIDARSVSVLAAAITCHSSNIKLADGCKGLQPKMTIAGQTVRPKLIAALVRLADELDEDYRRAEEFVETHAEIPAESHPYWRFCQCISGVDFGKPGGDITIHAQFSAEELRAPDTAREPCFLRFFANKLSKTNRERELMSGPLGESFARTRLSVVVEPPPDVQTFQTPVQFDFNDLDTVDQAAEQGAADRFVDRMRAKVAPAVVPVKAAREPRTTGTTRRAPKAAASADDGEDPPAPVEQIESAWGCSSRSEDDDKFAAAPAPAAYNHPHADLVDEIVLEALRPGEITVNVFGPPGSLLGRITKDVALKIGRRVIRLDLGRIRDGAGLNRELSDRLPAAYGTATHPLTRLRELTPPVVLEIRDVAALLRRREEAGQLLGVAGESALGAAEDVRDALAAVVNAAHGGRHLVLIRTVVPLQHLRQATARAVPSGSGLHALTLRARPSSHWDEWTKRVAAVMGAGAELDLARTLAQRIPYLFERAVRAARLGEVQMRADVEDAALALNEDLWPALPECCRVACKVIGGGGQPNETCAASLRRAELISDSPTTGYSPVVTAWQAAWARAETR